MLVISRQSCPLPPLKIINKITVWLIWILEHGLYKIKCYFLKNVSIMGSWFLFSDRSDEFLFCSPVKNDNNDHELSTFWELEDNSLSIALNTCILMKLCTCNYVYLLPLCVYALNWDGSFIGWFWPSHVTKKSRLITYNGRSLRRSLRKATSTLPRADLTRIIHHTAQPRM